MMAGLVVRSSVVGALHNSAVEEHRTGAADRTVAAEELHIVQEVEDRKTVVEGRRNMIVDRRLVEKERHTVAVVRIAGEAGHCNVKRRKAVLEERHIGLVAAHRKEVEVSDLHTVVDVRIVEVEGHRKEHLHRVVDKTWRLCEDPN